MPFGLDPNNTQKRLGDGFYEQKLIREQVASLTGRRFLDGYGSDDAQYAALMTAGVTFAQQYGLRPGIALTAEQMAALTSDIVWLQTQTVRLPDGCTHNAQVPKVHMAQAGADALKPGGAMITSEPWSSPARASRASRRATCRSSTSNAMQWARPEPRHPSRKSSKPQGASMSTSKARFLARLERNGDCEHGRWSGASSPADPRTARWMRAPMLILAASLLTACASRNAPPAPVPVVHRINVLPVMPIDRLYTENKGIPVGILWQAIADRVKSNNFTDLMDATRKDMATRMTAALLRRLKEQGYDAQLLEGVERPAASPDDVDYARIPGTDPVLHVYFRAVGMYS